MAKPANDWKKLVPRGKLQRYYHLQTNVPVGHEEEYDELGDYLARYGFIFENNVCEVLRGCLELVRVVFKEYVEKDIPMKVPDGYEHGPGTPCSKEKCDA